MESQQLEEPKSEKVHRYEVVLTGVFGRNRTPKFKIVKLVDMPADMAELALPDVEAKALRALKEIGTKSARWKAVKREVAIERIDGVLFETTMLMAEKVLLSGSL